MHETPADLEALDQLLERSYEDAGSHLKSIITPQRRLDAAAVVKRLVGMRLLALATVTADGRPLVSPVDGLFYRGQFWFGSSSTAVRFRHLRVRPVVSATHTAGEDLVVTVHGTASEIAHDDRGGFDEYAAEVYGDEWREWGATAPYARIDARRMYAAVFEDLTG